MLERLHAIEHALLPEAVRLIAARRRLVRPRQFASGHHRAVESSVYERGNGVRTTILAVSAGEVRVARAMLSVSDKTGIVEFARGLVDLGIQIVSTGGTARELAEGGVALRTISDFTGFPEIMDGRVKTLHPKLYAGCSRSATTPAHMLSAGSSTSSSSISYA